MKPVQKKIKNIDMMMTSATRELDVYDFGISDLSGKFTLNSKVYKVETNTLLSLPNREYKNIMKQYLHLRGINMDDRDEKSDLSIHMLLGANGYRRIKVQEILRVGSSGEPVGELTQFGWVLCLQEMRQI